LKNLIFVFAFVLLNFSVFAQEEREIEHFFNIEHENKIETEIIININTDKIIDFDSESIFIINSYHYHIKGMTIPVLLNNKVEIKTGEVILGTENFKKYLRNKTQLIINERVLKDNAHIDYTIGEINEDGKYPVDLHVYAEDTWNIIALPYPKFDSNTGLSLSVKARDYNFLGTMSPLRVDIGYELDRDGKNSFFLMLDSGIPFHFLGLNWHFNFDHDYTYRPNTALHHYYKNTTGLSIELPVKRTKLTLGFDESFILNEKYNEVGNDDDIFQNGIYLSSRPFISWEFPTGLNVGNYGELKYTPEVSAKFNHEINTKLSDTRIGPFLELSHTLGFERIDWIGNFKKGFSANINNSFNYDFYQSKIDKNPLTYDIIITSTAYFTITDFLGFSTRFMYRHWFNTYNDAAGDALRGIADKEIDAHYMISVNLDLPVRILRFKPSQWFNKDKLKILNFDLHLSPVIDTAVFYFYDNPSFSMDNFLLSGGFEIIIFPEFFRSLFFRASLCINILDLPELKNNYEIFLGMDFHY